jgi:mRNA interferase MazF
MPSPGDVVTVDFPGATGTKRRPAVVVSNDRYHSERPDLILAILTTNLASATASTDYVLKDWSAAGLHAASAFRSYFGMAVPGDVHVIGHLSDRDWQAVKDCVHRAFA